MNKNLAVRATGSAAELERTAADRRARARRPVRGVAGLLSIVVATLFLLSACGSDPTSAGSPSSDLDRSDVEDVAVAALTALLQSDFDTLRELALPDQSEDLDWVERAAALSPETDIEIESVAATVVEQTDDSATVVYSGEYCLPPTTTDVPITTVGSGGDGAGAAPESTLVVEEPKRCFQLDEAFGTDHPFEFERIDGDWFVSSLP